MKAKRIVSDLIFFLCLVIIPLYCEYFYFNMSQAKGHVYMIGVFFLLLSAAIITIVCHFRKENNTTTSRRGSLLFFEKILIIFGGIALLSSIFSESFPYAFWGTLGWSVGSYTIITLILIYFLLTKWTDRQRISFYKKMLIFSSFLVLTIGILHSAGIDVLFMHEGIYEPQWFDYLSTIGHKNWYVGYLSLIFPFFYMSFLKAQKKKERWVYGCMVELSLWNIILCDSDGIYLALAFCSLFIVPLFKKSSSYIRDTGLVITGYGLALLLIGQLPVFAPKVLSMEGISLQLLSMPLSFSIFAAGVLVSIILKKHPIEEAGRNRLSTFLIILLTLLLLGYLGYTLFHFDDSWGTYRGEIWKTSMEIYRNFPLRSKLIGVGPEMLKDYYASLSAHRSLVVLVSHSEPIQILLTMGLTGFLCWVLGWGSLMYHYVKNTFTEPEQMAYYLPMMAYFAQSLVNSAITTNVALLCIMAVLLRLQFIDNTL